MSKRIYQGLQALLQAFILEQDLFHSHILFPVRKYINISYVTVYRTYQQELNVSVVNQEYRFHRQGLYNNIHTRVISSAFSGGLSIPIIFRCSQGDTIHHVIIPNRSSTPPQQIWKNLKA